jgi:hypothetical protein
MLLSELIENAAIRSGIQNTDPALIALLGNPAISAIEVDDTIARSVSTNLMDINAAKANPLVKAHFTSTALSTVDQKLADLVSEYGLPEEILSEKSTYNKLDKVKEAIKGLKDAAGKKSDSPEAKQQIEALQAQLNSLKTEKEQAVNEVKQQWENERLNNAISNQFNAYQWNDSIPSAVRETVVKSLLDQELQASKAKIKRAENGITLVNAEDESLPFYLENKPVSFKEFTDSLMAKHNLIKTVADTGQATTFNTTVDPKGPNNRMPKYQKSVLDAAEQSLRDQGVTF